MTKYEAVKLANILVENFKVAAKKGVFQSYVTEDDEGEKILYIAAGPTAIRIDIDDMEVVEKVRRKGYFIEEEEYKKNILRILDQQD
tara:strand:+ start:565 stop:825 length:261 start_codon:yes stop_codon:yes gene_type:complete